MDGFERVTTRNRRFLNLLQFSETKSKAFLPSPLAPGEHGGSACTDTPVVRDAIHTHFVTLICKSTIIGGWVKHRADKRAKVGKIKS